MHDIKFSILKPFLSIQLNDIKAIHVLMPVSPLSVSRSFSSSLLKFCILFTNTPYPPPPGLGNLFLLAVSEFEYSFILLCLAYFA